MLAALLCTVGVYAATSVHLEPAGIDPDNVNSLQRGARNYMNYCSGCHSAGTVDSGGSNLAGKQAKLTNNLGSISGAMNGITLTEQEILDLAAFLSAVK